MSDLDSTAIKQWMVENRAMALRSVHVTSQLLKVPSPVLTRRQMDGLVKLTKTANIEEAKRKLDTIGE